jgi:hypothetical protein
MMKFVEKVDWEKVRTVCIQYNLCTGASCKEYEDIMNLTKKTARKAIPEMAAAIANTSHTELTEVEIASMLFNRCCVRYCE